ncbi:hypothetical protein CGRA01v4_10279 [Colletotrichum graminicola]|nr:hypothetical protein CGRA01v4_10279 [Colletotrichum graminicola]
MLLFLHAPPSSFQLHLGDDGRPATDTLCPRRTPALVPVQRLIEVQAWASNELSSLDGIMEVKCYVCCCYPYAPYFIQNLSASVRPTGANFSDPIHALILFTAESPLTPLVFTVAHTRYTILAFCSTDTRRPRSFLPQTFRLFCITLDQYSYFHNTPW